MLKKLRNKKTAKRILVFLAIIIIPAFAFWGFSSVLRSKQEAAYIGKVFGRKIPAQEFKETLDAIRRQGIIQYGEDFSKVENTLNLQGQAWDRLVLLAEARKRKIRISDKELTDFIETYPFFQKKGRFDNRLYSEMLRYVLRTQPRIFEEQTRQNMSISKLYKELTDKINLTDPEVKEEYRKQKEELELEYIAAGPADFAKDLSFDDKEVKDYFLKNSLSFKQPLSFNLEYVVLQKEEPSIDKKIKQFYLRMKKKEPFAKIAKDFGLTVKETGLFAEGGLIPGMGWSAEIMKLISKLKRGEYLNPVVMDKYFYILKAKERREPNIPDFDLVKDKVKEVLMRDQSKRIAKEKIAECLEKIKGVNFEAAAKLCALKSGTTKPFKYGSYIEGIGASDIFWTAGKNLKEDQISEIIETPGGFYIIKLKSRQPLDERKFSEEKESFSQTLLLQKKQEYFSNFIEELKKKALEIF